MLRKLNDNMEKLLHHQTTTVDYKNKSSYKVQVQNNRLCWCHNKFGVNAKCCTLPCGLLENANAWELSTMFPAAMPIRINNALIFVIDKCSKQKFLVDSRTAVSLTPPTTCERHEQHPEFDLFPDSKLPIDMYGTRLLTYHLAICGRRIQPTHLRLWLPRIPHHLGGCRLTPFGAQMILSEDSMSTLQNSTTLITIINQHSEFIKLLEDSLWSPYLTFGTLSPTGVFQYINTSGPPAHASPRHLPPQIALKSQSQVWLPG